MKRKLMICLFTMIGLFLNVAFADSADELTQLLSPIRTMEANFSQTVMDNRGRVVQRAYGRMSIERPGKFRWDVKKPNPQLIVANGSRVWIYDADLQQVSVRSIRQSSGTPALLLSQGSLDINDDYHVTKMPNKMNGWNWFLLKPRQSDNMFSTMQLGFANGQIRQMRLRDQLGHQTSIQFANTRLNNKIASSAFVFRAPRNVDVIDETKRQR